MAEAPRLLNVEVAAHGDAWEWQLLDQADIIISGVERTREAAQREGDDALFDSLLAGRAKPLHRSQE